MIIQQLFLKKPKSTLATILQRPKHYFDKNKYFMLKTQMLFWHYFTKSKYYFGTCLQSSNTIFDTCFTYTKSLTCGKYNYSSLKKYFSYKIYESPCISPMAKLFIL